MKVEQRTFGYLMYSKLIDMGIDDYTARYKCKLYPFNE